ncbi:GNAT family N-acetyltransferase [Nonomuraea sp. NPDC049152]|uniref:GNAT family N-acetyltransferase n=1 Tax=Nonomuraea sp. NPDC049152 TaxID=3154350 RepID=UPI0033F31B31
MALRHEPNDFGHIGYGIRPSARRRGLATWALGRILDEARLLGLDRVLITCAADNVASAKTIERQGGVLEDVRDTQHGRTGRRRPSTSTSPSGPSRRHGPAAGARAPHHGEIGLECDRRLLVRPVMSLHVERLPLAARGDPGPPGHRALADPQPVRPQRAPRRGSGR